MQHDSSGLQTCSIITVAFITLNLRTKLIIIFIIQKQYQASGPLVIDAVEMEIIKTDHIVGVRKAIDLNVREHILPHYYSHPHCSLHHPPYHEPLLCFIGYCHWVCVLGSVPSRLTGVWRSLQQEGVKGEEGGG